MSKYYSPYLFERKYPYAAGAVKGAARGTAWAIRNKGAIAAAAMAMSLGRAKRGGIYHSGLSGEGYRSGGGAKPLKGKSYATSRLRKARRRERKKCTNLKGYALKKKVCQLERRVKDLQHSESSSLGKITYRKFQTNTIRAGNNAQAVARAEVNNLSNMEAVLAQLLYYNPSAPATLVTADGTSGTYQKEFLFKTVYAKYLLRNNYQTDAEVTVYLIKPKQDTSINASLSWSNAIADDAGNSSAVTDYGIYPNEFDTFRDNWTAKRVLTKSLAPGQSCEVSHTENDIFYDPAFTDSHSLAYQKGFKMFGFLTIVKGVLSHDTTVSTEQGTAEAGVDTLLQSNYVVHYDAGVNLSYVYQDTTLDTPTNGFVQSHQPIPDNIAYSVA